MDDGKQKGSVLSNCEKSNIRTEKVHFCTFHFPFAIHLHTYLTLARSIVLFIINEKI